MHNNPNRFTHSYSIWFIFNLIIILSASIPHSVQAQEQINEIPEISITQAINIALANNTELKRSLLSVEDAEQQIRSAWSAVMPSVAVSANYTRNLEIPVTFLPAIIFDQNADPNELLPVAFGTDNSWTGGLTATQTIFSGQAFVGISAADLYKTAQKEALRATAQGVVTQTRIVYYQVLTAKEQHRLIEAQYNRLNENLEDIRKLFDQGFTDEYSVLQIEVQLSNIIPQLTQARYGIEKARRELLDVIGLPLDLPIKVVGNLSTYDIYIEQVSDTVNSELKTIDMSTPINIKRDSLSIYPAFEARGDLRILDKQYKLQKKQLSAQKSNFLPTISANYGLNWTASQGGNPVFFGTDDTRARSQVIGVSIQLPIFEGFRRSSAIQQTRIQIKDVQLQTEQTRRTALKEILSTQESIEEIFLAGKATKKALELARIGYERAQSRQNAGVGSQQELIDAELQLRQAEITHSQSVSNYLISKAQYDQAIGQVPFVEDPDSIQKKINQ